MKLSNRCVAVSTGKLLMAGLLSAFVICQPVSAQESNVYRWVDKEGTQHFTDIPPANGEVEQLAISSRRTNNRAVRSQMADRAEANSVARLRESQRAEEAAVDKNNQADIADQRRANCTQSKATQKKYFEAHQLYKPGANGEREYLDDAAIDAARISANKAVQEWCSE